jgi:hypothetical protein
MSMRRPRLPVQELIERTLQMIDAYSGLPAPTRSDIMHWTGLRRREITPFLESLHRQRLIVVRRKGRPPNHFYRFKVVGGKPATRWTRRRRPQR